MASSLFSHPRRSYPRAIVSTTLIELRMRHFSGMVCENMGWWGNAHGDLFVKWHAGVVG